MNTARIVTFFVLADIALSFYLPGISPVNYSPGDSLDLKVSRLASLVTPAQHVDYYSLPFCSPSKLEEKVETLSDILRGDRTQNSPFQFVVKKNQECTHLCVKEYSKDSLTQFIDRIKGGYRANWVVDGLPAAISREFHQGDLEELSSYYELGYPIGLKSEISPGKGKKETYYLNNHINIKFLYNTDPSADGLHITGFLVEPESVKYTWNEEYHQMNDSCHPKSGTQLDLSIPSGSETLRVIWSYSVQWEESLVQWVQRWDKYAENADTQINWFSIINSLMIVLFLTGMVAMIMMRTLHADFRRYNQYEIKEDVLEETGWKLVAGDVFRPPKNPMVLSVLAGTGMEIFGIIAVIIGFGLLSAIFPVYRAGIFLAAVVMFVIMRFIAGYTSARNFRMLKGQDLTRNTIWTALLIPGMISAVLLFLNIVISGQKDSGAVPFGRLLLLIVLYFLFSTPLTFIGSFFGTRHAVTEHPVRTHHYPRTIPAQQWYLKPAFSVFIGGILPFGAVFVQLFFIFSAIWGHQFYYIFGFLFLVFVILVMSCAEVAIVMCYFQLCSEDYRWWWRAYLTAGASAFYLFLYSIFYFTRLDNYTISAGLLFFGYSAIMSFTFFVLTGTIGYFACLIFVRKIYAQVKAD